MSGQLGSALEKWRSVVLTALVACMMPSKARGRAVPDSMFLCFGVLMWFGISAVTLLWRRADDLLLRSWCPDFAKHRVAERC